MNGTSIFNLLGRLAIDGTEEAKKELKEVSKSGEDTKNKLNVSLKDIGEKAGELGKSMATGLAVGITAITASYEATKEFRSDLGRLEAGYEGVGLSVETSNRVFKDFFGILGETDTAVEASNLLKELAQDEQGLAEWTTIATGVYARFPDSIPIEALIESANETAKVGQVTGNLADALNWAGVSEEQFNEKLAKANTEAEREKIIRETLNGLYSDSANEYQKNNKGLIDNNKAQAELNMKMAETMEKVEPIITQGKILMAEVLVKLQPLITWIIDNIDIIAPIVLTIVGALTVFSTVMGIVNAVMLASPVTWIVLAIVAALAALVAIIVIVVKHWDEIKEATSNAINKMKDAVEKGIEKIKSFFEKIINFVKENWQNLLLLLVNPFAGAFKLLYDNCEGFRNFVDKWIAKIRDFFVNGFNNIKNKVVSTVTNLVDGVKEKFNSFRTAVSNIFNKVKDAISKPIEKARDIVKGIVDKIKGFFNFKIELPKIKLPHFSIKPKGWKMGDLLEGSIPKLGIDWYAKAVNSPMLLEDPTAFGISPNGNIRVGGEAGSELVGGTSTIMNMIGEAVSSNNSGIEYRLDKLNSNLASYTEAIRNLQVVLSTGELVGAIANPMDKALGVIADDRRRGR